MGRLLAVIRPQSLGTWLVYLLIAPITLLTLVNTATGMTDIQQLRSQGEDRVRVRLFSPATLMMSRTRYEHTSLTRQTLKISLLPLLFGAAVVAAMQWRQVYGQTSPSYWGRRLDGQDTAEV